MSDKGGTGPSLRPGHGKWGKGEKVKDVRKALRRLMALYRRHLPLVILGLIFLITATVLGAMAPAVMGRAITRHLERNLNLPLFFRQMALLALIYGAVFLVRTAGSIFTNILSNKIVFQLRQEAFHHVQRLSIGYFDRKGAGDIISRLTNDVEKVHDFVAHGLFGAVDAVLTFFGIVTFMVLLNLPMTGVVLLVVPVTVIALLKIGKIARKNARENQKQVGIITAAVEESVTGMKVIQSFHREEEELKEFIKKAEKQRDASIRFQRSSFLMMPTMQITGAISLTLVIGFGGSMAVLYPEIFSIGLITSFIVYARRIVEPFRSIANIYSLFNSALAGAERIFEVIDSEDEIPRAPSPRSADNMEGDVEFRNVTFGYEQGEAVLENISLHAEPGEVTALVGPTGAGKTTVINLLARFYDPGEGEIVVDGVNIREYDLRRYRSALGIVLQEPFFFAASIRENLLYGRPDASEEEMIAAAGSAWAHHFITRLPHGYDTMLTERGMNLSQGERQLLGIARTLLSDPRILILDEATSSVDSLTERKIQKAVAAVMEGRTTFIIAHRLSTIKRADRVVVINDKRILEQGNHEELIQSGGLYSRLYSMQFDNEEQPGE